MKSKFVLALFFILAAVTSCLEREEYIPYDGEGIPISVTGAISQEATKVNANGFEDGDALGIYAVNYTNNNQTPGVLLDNGNQVDHVKYILDEKNGKWNPVRPVYYKDVNTNIDLYAYYPYAAPSTVSNYNFEVQQDQNTAKKNNKLGGYEASDFLWGKSENVQPTETAIKVTLNHMMSGVRVVLAQGTGFEAGDFDLIGKSVMVKGTTRKASVNLSNGEVTPIGGAQQTGIVMALQSDNSFRAIVVPQTVNSGTELFAITIDGIVYTYKHSSNYNFQAGKLSEFKLTINRKPLTGEYELVLSDTQITDWKEDLNTHEGEARQYYCVNMTEPASLGKLIKENKKNPDKIKNLKISGVMTESDFRYMRDSMEILEAVNLKEVRVVDCYHWDENGEMELVNDIIPYEAFRGKKSLYHFTFPETITEILGIAFYESSLSGALVIPDEVKIIEEHAFYNTNITSISLPSSLQKVDEWAFAHCNSLSGTLLLPETLTRIEGAAFYECSFTGNLSLPENLEYIGQAAFAYSGNYSGDLVIPEKINELLPETFSQARFTGSLHLNNVTSIDSRCFWLCGFKGELNLPEGLVELADNAFADNEFTTINFPSSLKTIEHNAFSNNWRLTGGVKFQEGLISIGKEAFLNCSTIEYVELPSSLQTIQDGGFNACYAINKIISKSVEPPIVHSNVFVGVAKDDFILEVPENAVVRYKADPVWGEFRKISAHHDFSISRDIARALNAEKSTKYVVHAPANFSWSVESKPDWITVTPSSGTGKTEVTVTFNKMEKSDVETVRIEKYDYWGNYCGEEFQGRAGEIVFLLNDKDYRSTMTVQQYDYEYNDGDVVELNKATKGKGVNVIFMGDCYDARDISSGSYLNNLQEGFEHMFAVEPYATYKDYFNVYAVFGLSDDSGVGTVNNVKDAKFGSQYSLQGVCPDKAKCFEYALKAAPDADFSKTLIVLVENSNEYGGICYMWEDGSAIAVCPTSTEPYPYDFRGLVQHEAAGHGFGKLLDEYIYHNEFIQSCNCSCCQHLEDLLYAKAIGWGRNLEATGDINQVGWSHLIFNPKYSNVVDVFEGGFFHSRGVFRCESISCMNNNIPYFSAISRQAIVERIMEYAGEEFTLEKFYANDSDAFGPTTKGLVDKYGTLPSSAARTKQYAPVIVGDKPDFRRN